MGESKAWLDFGGEPMLQRVVGRICQAVLSCVVVRAAGQSLPQLPPEVRVIEDPVLDQGPLQGIACGLAALHASCEFAFVCSTDAPFIEPQFVKRLVELAAGGYDIVVPHSDGHAHPLAAIYATALHEKATDLLRQDKRRPAFLFDEATTLHADADLLLADDALRAIDPALDSLRNLNTPEDARAARVIARV
jgi:molybdopterin-guanine dinucleotide biosynthesis protein A